jgi:hypothetical protein
VYATFNGKKVPLDEITLDDIGWDKQATQDSQTLVLHLTENDLVKVGTALFASAQEALDEDPEYFQGEYMSDVPVPTSEHLFLENPMLLTSYLENAFWSRQTILAILDSMELPGSSSLEKATYWIQGFRQVLKAGEGVAVEFGVWVKQ